MDQRIMTEPILNTSDYIREGFIALLKADSYLSTQFVRNAAAYIYEEPFETVTISNFPACSLYDMTEISYNDSGNYYEYATETFICEVAAQSAYWRDAKTTVSKLLLAVRDVLRGYVNSSNDLMSIINKLSITNVRHIGAAKATNNMWTYAAEIEFRVTYTEGLEAL